ncbi:MAG: helix-turn-helix domain-containing protein [Candidatus Gastranaerophilaceae bacterium]
MPTLKEKLGLRIKYLRKKNGLSQENLAELINMDKPNLSNIERGKRFMTAETLEKIAKALNTTERELFDFSESTPQKYFRADIEKFLDSFEEKDLKFFLDIMNSYIKIK